MEQGTGNNGSNGPLDQNTRDPTKAKTEVLYLIIGKAVKTIRFLDISPTI